MTVNIHIQIDAITDSQTLEKVLKRLPGLFDEFLLYELDSPHFLIADTTTTAAASTDSTNQNETFKVSFRKSIPANKGFATLTYRCDTAFVEKISDHYVLISGEFDVFYENSDKPKKEVIKRMRKKIGSSSLTIG